jgi:hypothetical protein
MRATRILVAAGACALVACDQHTGTPCGNLVCGANAICTASWETGCECKDGYEGDPEAGCTDVDECLGNPCGPLEKCTNLPGTYLCNGESEACDLRIANAFNDGRQKGYQDGFSDAQNAASNDARYAQCQQQCPGMGICQACCMGMQDACPPNP